MSKTQD